MKQPRVLRLAALVFPLIVACSSGAAPQTAVDATVALPVDRPAPVLQATAARVPAACASANPMLLRVVDKQRGLPSDHVPPALIRIDDRWSVPGFEGQTLQAQTAESLVELLTAARAAGHDLRLRSGYRSYAEQVETYRYWVARLGEQQARRESALAGHSEHQLGATADLSSAAVRWELIEEFGATPEARWLADHAHEYGFALSYPQDSEAVTGYVWEPWHIRYVGRDCAVAWKASGLVLVRFLETLDGRAQ